MKTKDSLLLENAYELIQIKQFLLSEGYSISEIEQAIVEEKLGDIFNNAKKMAANVGVAATLGATALGFGNSLTNNPDQAQPKQPKISLNSNVAAYNPIMLKAYKYVTGRDFETDKKDPKFSEFGPMYVIQNVLNKAGGNGGVDTGTLVNLIKNEISQNPNSFKTDDSSKLDGTVKSILSKTQNLPKQPATGGKFGDPAANKRMLQQLPQ
jgi:hypothetical protein